MGLNGLIPVDEEVYHSRLRNHEDVIYTKDAENDVRHRVRANNVRSQYQLNIEAHFYDQVLQDDAIIAVDIWPPSGIDLLYVPKPQGLELPHVPDLEDEAYLELMDLDALSVEFVESAASVVITGPQIEKSNPTVINLSSDDENEYPEHVIPHLEIIDISSDDE
ncbi:unnamed protein product [Prunus armeniaca]